MSEFGGRQFDVTDGWGSEDHYERGAEVVLQRGSVSGTVMNELQADRHGRRRYTLRTHAGVQRAHVGELRPLVRKDAR